MDDPVRDSDDGDGDRAHLDVLDYGECMDLLARGSIGRLAVVVDHYPQIFPVNYRLDDFVVVFRTHIGTKLLAAHQQNVAFEIDAVDVTTHTGWSVMVQGMAEDVTGRDGDVVVRRAEDLGIEPWTGSPEQRIVRIIPAHVTGRRIVPARFGWPTDSRGYL